MTGPDPAHQPDGAALSAADPSDPRPGSRTFTIEGRSAPALFVVGWLATILGLGTIGVALISGSDLASLLLTIGLVVLAVGLVAGAGAQGIERRARGVSAYQGPSPVLVFAAAIPISLIAVLLIGAVLTITGLDIEGPLGRFASVVVQALVYVGVIRLLIVDTGALSWADMGVRRLDRRAVGELLGGAAWALPVIVLTIPIAVVLGLLFQATPESPLPPTGENVGFVIQLIAGAIVAPIGEELMFRGFATTAWARSIGDRRAIVRGAVFFAFIHVIGVSGATAGEAISLAMIAFGTRIPVGLVLGWLFLRSRSIWTPIGLHAAFNATLLVIAEAAIRSGAV